MKKKETRKIVGVSFTLAQYDKFAAVQKETGRATLGPVIADCAMFGLPIFRRFMDGGGEGGK